MPGRAAVLLLFVASGATGLVYEVVWTRQLSLVFGVSIFAASAVLAAFMGGLALGSYAAGRWIDRVSRPLRVYALLEIGVGLTALAMPVAFRALEPLYLRVADGLADHFLIFNLARALLASLPLLVPTVLMGATLPTIARGLVDRRDRIGWSTGLLYAANTVGGVTGCLAAGFLLIPSLGLWTTTRVTAATNLAIAAIVLLGGFDRRVRPAESAGAGSAAPIAPLGRLAVLALFVYAASGFVALGFEVLWTRTLVLHLHNTSYAFTLMLAVFLAGLALGGALLVRVYDRIRHPVLWLGVVQVGVALSALAAGAMYGSLRDLTRGGGAEALVSWGQAVGLMGLRAALVMLPSTILLGMTFPLVARAVCSDLSELGRRLGTAYAANTLGAILGALSAAFLLIPALGIRGSLVALSATSALLGAACFAAAAPRGRALLAAAAVAAAGVPAFLVPPTLFSDAYDSPGWKLVYYREGITDTTGVYEHLETGGRFLAYGDQRGTAGTFTDSLNRREAHVAHLLHPEPVRSLQIGFGVGNTLAAAALYPSVRELDCVELSPHVRETAGYFWTNQGVLDDPKVRLIIDDGRNYLFRTRKRYDVITLEPPEIFTADVVNLYTTEFYELARRALTEDGLLAQWLPTYTLGERETRMLVRSVAEVFPHTSLWLYGRYIEGRRPANMLLAVGSNQPLQVDLARLEERMAEAPLREDLVRTEMGTPGDLLSLFLIGGPRLDRWLGEVAPVVDDRTVVDFTTPKLRQAAFGFGALRVFEDLSSRRVRLEHDVTMLRLFQRLRSPLLPTLALAPPARVDAVLSHVAAHRRDFDRQIEMAVSAAKRAARGRGPAG